MADGTPPPKRIDTGVPGLDDILGGGLPPHRLYLLEGAPGSGKTTVALQFLLAAAGRGERTLYVTLSETSEELHAVADSHGWSLDGIDLFELSTAEEVLGLGQEQTLLHPWEIELGETIKLITNEVERLRPIRVVFDSLSEMRLLAQDSLRYRRQVLTLKQFFAGRGITVLLVDDMTGNQGERDVHLHSLSHGVITLERLTLDFGAARRRLQIQKLRGVDFRAGFHDFAIRHGGVVVFPRLVAAGHHMPFVGDPVASGLDALDALLHGGPLRGTSTLVTGPAGCGKTNLAMQYVSAACARGERAVLYEFDERIGTLLLRSKALGMDLQPCIDAGLLHIRQIDPAEVAPGEFTWMVTSEVRENDARLIVIDSLSGYMAAMPQEAELILQMHELLSFLNQQGVVTFLINSQQSLVGSMSTPGLNISYLADTVLLLRYFEAGGRIRKALSVIKNRGGPHEDTIRELRIDQQGLRVGAVLTGFKGVLTGVPEYVGSGGPLLEDRGDAGKP
ncbi:ATPase domain-containing protein [Azospirillum doebereinerae]